MPNGPDGRQPFDRDPANPGSLTRQFMTYGKDSDGDEIPLKTLRITNNTADTVFPIMRDPNAPTLKGNLAVGLYDPYDPPDKEYRGYIGYKQGGQLLLRPEKGRKHYRASAAGLLEWSAASASVPTASPLHTDVLPNPLRYDPNSQRSITTACGNLRCPGDTIPNGVVMWYRAEPPRAPTDDAEDQLAEWTIRDHVYLVNDDITRKTNDEIPGQSIGHADQLRCLQCRQPLSAAGDGGERRLGGCRKKPGDRRIRTGMAGSRGRTPMFTAGPAPTTRSTFSKPKSGHSPPTPIGSSGSILRTTKAGRSTTSPTPPTTRRRP